jgi:hypothetical protein
MFLEFAENTECVTKRPKTLSDKLDMSSTNPLLENDKIKEIEQEAVVEEKSVEKEEET